LPSKTEGIHWVSSTSSASASRDCPSALAILATR
jgi:hypothetical protein